MRTITTDSETWIGCVLTDSKDRRLGTIADVYYDEHTEQPSWMLVRTGRFGAKHTLVPLSGAGPVHGTVQTPHSKRQIDAAPHIDPADTLSDDELRDLYDHYDVPLSEAAAADLRETPSRPPLAERVLAYIAVSETTRPLRADQRVRQLPHA